VISCAGDTWNRLALHDLSSDAVFESPGVESAMGTPGEQSW
jgi:hypothetical protein